MNNHFTIIIPSYNVEKWIDNTLSSALNQDYDNFDVIFIDAKSTDNTYLKACSFKDKYNNLIVIQNDIRKYPIENIKIGTYAAKDNSICLNLDGDDWLKDNQVLNKLNKIYTDDVWMTYGTYEEFPYRDVSMYYYPYPYDVIKNNTFRNYNWLASHLRTYRKELFIKIDDKDMREENGNYFSMTGDMAIQFPMLEMSGYHSKHIHDILYVYNKTNDNSDFNVNINKQIELERYIRNKNKYDKLTSL